MDQTFSPAISIQKNQAVSSQPLTATKVRDTGYFEVAFGISTLFLFAVILYGTVATLV